MIDRASSWAPIRVVLKSVAVVVVSSIIGISTGSRSVQAWEKHHSLIPWVLKTLSEDTQKNLRSPIPAPCMEQDRATFARLTTELNLNPEGILFPTSPDACKTHRTTWGGEILAGTFVDDPDLGMDQNLDESSDPDGFRRWMGGTKGPTSQGFRHMYFGGWKPSHPLTTFQIPFRAVGLAPERVELLATQAKSLLRSPDPQQRAWGFRVLAWGLHYVQDLAQPFHSVQLVSLRIVPWSAILHWPPSEAFQNLVKESTRTVANYHQAYEEYVLSQIRTGDESPFESCLTRASELAKLSFDSKTNPHPRELAMEVVRRSIELAPRVGRAEYRFFGDRLMHPEVNLVAKQGSLNYDDYATRPDLTEEREELHRVTCQALSNAVHASQKLIDWALQP